MPANPHPQCNVLLVSHRLEATRGPDLATEIERHAWPLQKMVLPDEPEARLDDAASQTIDIAFFSGDIHPVHSRQFFSALRKAPRLRWLHVFNAGVDHPIYTEMLERGVRLSTSAGSASEPIAQTAITGMLMLARNFRRWLAAQREHRWAPIRAPHEPADLEGQTAVILGVGHIGNEIARLARVLGLNVIGVRRSGPRPEDHAQEIAPPSALGDVLTRADWLFVACPLTADTRRLIGADMLARLPRHARIINIARGEIIDESALIDALRGERLGGAYLDVFEQEPLPPESPLWDMPNVFVSPHNASASAGHEQRVYALFVENLGRWMREEPLLNEVRRDP